jgi:hypothetical protein
VWAPHPESKLLILVQYETCVENRGRRLCRVIPVRLADYPSAFDVLAKDMFVDWPLCGSVNLPCSAYAVHVDRLTQRQYRRTFHRNGTQIVIPRQWDVARWLNTVPDFGFVSDRDLAEACFFPTYYTLDEAFALLDKGEKLTVAINPRVIVAGDQTGKRMFYYNGLLAATAHGDRLFPCGDELLVRRIIKLTDGRYRDTSYS